MKCLYIFIYSFFDLKYSWGFPGGSDSKESPAMQKIQAQSLGLEVPLEKGKATHPSTLAWRIPCTEGPGDTQSVGSPGVRRDWAPNTFIVNLQYCVRRVQKSDSVTQEYVCVLFRFCSLIRNSVPCAI